MTIYKKGLYFGMAVCDITTGTFLTTSIKKDNNFEKLIDEMAKYCPAEVVVNTALYETKTEISKIHEKFNSYITKYENEQFSENITGSYSYKNETGKEITDLQNKELEVYAISGMLSYLSSTQKIELSHINTITFYEINKHMLMDSNTRRNLELTERMRDGSKKSTLLWVLDKTNTAMGGRALRRIIHEPLIDVNMINERLSSVSELRNSLILRGDLVEKLKKIYDIERLVGRIAYGNTNRTRHDSSKKFYK
jgi:DNA mismatch repair protein MutS